MAALALVDGGLGAYDPLLAQSQCVQETSVAINAVWAGIIVRYSVITGARCSQRTNPAQQPMSRQLKSALGLYFVGIGPLLARPFTHIT